MIWFIKTFRRSLGALGGLLTLIFLASDVRDIPQALAGWRRMFAMIDQNTALWIFSISALVYIFWVDARPFIERWRGGSSSPISVANELVWKTTIFQDGEVSFCKNVCYLQVYNNSRKRRSARSVRVRTYTIGEPVSAATASGADEADMHYGEVVWFRLGYILSTKAFGFFVGDEGPSEEDLTAVKHGLGKTSFTFKRADKSGIGLHYLGASDDAFSANPMSFFTARVSASDTPLIEVKFRLDRKTLEYDGPEIRSPISIVSAKEV
jgi:hypothetical protein